MAANTAPIFALIPETKVAKITATTTDKSGATTTNIVDVLTAATDGTKITKIKFKFEGTSTAGTFLIWISDTTNTTNYLFDETTYDAITSSTTVATEGKTLLYSDLQLKSGQRLKVGATTVNTTIHVTASIGDFS